MHSPGNMITEDRSAASVYVPAILAGLAAAIAGGVVWGLIVKWTEYEVGFVAWGIGFIVAMAILLATRGQRGVPLQAIAIACALLGIAIGKYLSFAWVISDVAQEQTGGLVDFPVFSRDTIDLFFDELGVVFDWIDLLWAGLAVFTAWKTLAPESPEPEPVEAPAEEGPTTAPREP